MSRRNRTPSTDFKRQVVAEYHADETLHPHGRRHDLSRNLIRIWIEKFDVGAMVKTPHDPVHPKGRTP